MKLIIAIIQDKFVNTLVRGFLKEDIKITKLSSTGGFLKDGNSTFLIGVPEENLDLAKKIIANAADYLSEDGILVVEVGNSFIALQEQFPDVPFKWVEFKNGGCGVFVLTYQDLVNYAHLFEEYRS